MINRKKNSAPLICVTGPLSTISQPLVGSFWDLEEQSDAKLNIARALNFKERSKVRIICLPQAIKLQTLQRVYVKRIRITRRKSLRNRNMEEIERYGSAGQTAINRQV